MGQIDVYYWLKNQYEIGNTQWFTVQEISKGLKDNGATNGMLDKLRVDCIKLAVSKCIKVKDLDTTGFNNYKRVFRYEEQKFTRQK